MMAIGSDRVQVYKTESTAGGGKDSDRGPYGGPVAINPQQDVIESAGLYLNDESNRDENVAVFRDGSDMKLKDENNPTGLSLTALAGGGGDTPTLLVFTCRKGSSGTIPQGAPVYLVDWNAGGWAEVEPAKADSPSTMPAIGLARTELTSAADGEAVAFGVITSIDTSSYSMVDRLYVSATTAGELTITRPTGGSSLIQIVAKVLKVDASTGQLLVSGAGRVNALPNLTAGKYWKGDADGIPAEAIPFGAEVGDAESLAQSFTTSTSWVQKLRFTTPAAIPAGRYRVGWSFEWQYESAANDYLCRVQVDDKTTIMEMVQEPADAGSDQWNPKSGFGYVDLANSTHFVDLDYRAGIVLYSAHIRRARLEFWRVS